MTTSEKLRRILLVEDDDSTRLAAITKLRKEGFEVDEAADGVLALEQLEKRQDYDAILVDLRMPRGDGFHFLEKKKNDKRVEHIPVVVFTNLSQGEYIDRALELGAKGYLVKAHHSLNEIIDELRNCIDGKACRIDR